MKKTLAQQEAARKKSLGELGELFGIKALVDDEFDCIRNLNDDKMNYPYADLYAEKSGQRYVISVKSRNKFQKNGKQNTQYNLGNNVHLKAADAEKDKNAIAYWMAIEFDKLTYSVYFGPLSDLEDKKAISIKECEKNDKYWLVKDKRHFFDFDYFENIKSID